MAKFSRRPSLSNSPTRIARWRPDPVAKAAIGRSLRDFLPLLNGEQRLLLACRLGEVATLGNKLPDASSHEPLIRAAFLRFLLLGGDEQAPVHEHGVNLRGAIVEGKLDLSGCKIPHNVALDHCRFTDLLLAQDTRFDGFVSMQGSFLPRGISADRMLCNSNLFLRSGFEATGEVRLLGAQIGGNLECRGGQFKVEYGDALLADNVIVKGIVRLTEGFKATGKVRLLGAQIGGSLICRGGQFVVSDGEALSADRAAVRGGVFFSDGMRATGEVRLLGAQIGGNLECGGGRFEVKEGDALSADNVVVKGSVFIGDGFKATGQVRLLGAQIGGDLACRSGQFEVKDGIALSADRAVVNGGVFFTDGMKATGEVRLLGVQIGGNLQCDGGQFEVEEGDALSADRAVVKGNVFLTGSFKATGQVRLLGTQIGGALACGGGHFEVKAGDALLADGAVVKGDVFLTDRFRATGQVRLLGVQIEGDLSCGGGQFEVKEGDALSADGAIVKGSVYFNDGFKATGKVRLLGARIGGNFTCAGGLFEGKNGAALSTEGASVGGAWFLTRFRNPVVVNASHMQVAVLVDAIESWGTGSVLDGLRFGALGGNSSTQAHDRLAWLRTQRSAHLGGTEDGEDFRPQPWRHLQRVLREMGHAEDARQIGIAFETRMRETGRIGRSPPDAWAPAAWSKRLIAQTGHTLFGWLTGYGYRPMRLMGWMALVWLICSVSYWLLALPPYGAIGPSDPLVFQNERYADCVPGSEAARKLAARGAKNAGNWYLCEPLPAEYSTFSPLAFSLDIILPLVDLGQEKSWGAVIATPQPQVLKELLTLSPGHMVRWLVWFETVFGWIASLLLVGIVSGFAKRTEE